MDADTVITPNFIAKSVAAFDEDTRLGGVSGAYGAKPGGPSLPTWAEAPAP
jgi:cellulose synthase/poly-beta-1,6-N-acetylglucosamine synthase-like glycosyltransferase